MENQQLLKYIGETKTDKILDNITKEFREKLLIRFPNYYNDQILKSCSIITVTKNNEIKSIGMSCMNDLLTDNFGNFLKGIIGFQGFQLIDIAGLSRDYNCASGTTAFNMTGVGSIGTKIQIGKGTTPATRQDINIETPFAVSPENIAFQIIGSGGWNSGLGQVSITGAITAGASGSISESILLSTWRNTNIGTGISVMARDNISPVSNFIIGDTINVNYTLLMS